MDDETPWVTVDVKDVGCVVVGDDDENESCNCSMMAVVRASKSSRTWMLISD